MDSMKQIETLQKQRRERGEQIDALKNQQRPAHRHTLRHAMEILADNQATGTVGTAPKRKRSSWNQFSLRDSIRESLRSTSFSSNRSSYQRSMSSPAPISPVEQGPSQLANPLRLVRQSSSYIDHQRLRLGLSGGIDTSASSSPRDLQSHSERRLSHDRTYSLDSPRESKAAAKASRKRKSSYERSQSLPNTPTTPSERQSLHGLHPSSDHATNLDPIVEASPAPNEQGLGETTLTPPSEEHKTVSALDGNR